MQVHIAVFKWKDGTSEARVTAALAAVKALEGEVEGVHEIYVGENTSQWNQGFTHAVVVIGEDPAAIDAYRRHPDHVTVARDIEEMELDGIGIDFGDTE